MARWLHCLRSMGRAILVLLGTVSIGWGLVCLLASSALPQWTGLSGPEHGELYAEALAVNVGLLPALGVFALIGAALPSLTLAAALVFVLCGTGATAGRFLAMTRGADTGPYNGVALALQFIIILMAGAAYFSESARLSRKAEERKKAERAALDAVLTADHAEAKGTSLNSTG